MRIGLEQKSKSSSVTGCLKIPVGRKKTERGFRSEALKPEFWHKHKLQHEAKKVPELHRESKEIGAARAVRQRFVARVSVRVKVCC